MGKRIIISGGGTGGHIFPAISIANAIKRLAPDTELLFVGALGKMEMEKVPAAGYPIVGLDIQGFNRKSWFKNIGLLFKLLKSIRKARQIIKTFKPDAAIGVGGYASGPLLHTAGKMGVPYIIQEQNSFAGITNQRLGKKADRICVAFDGMERFFPQAKIMVTGNPIRKAVVDIEGKRAEALRYFGLSAERKTILVTGGSLGAATLNNSLLKALEWLQQGDTQVIWQCGGYYYDTLKAQVDARYAHVVLTAFLDRMDLAYAAADVIIARAGAGTIAELGVVGKPTILVPSPNVAEDHQTFNAKALIEKDAAWMVTDAEAMDVLFPKAIQLLDDESTQQRLSTNMKALARTDADEQIAKVALDLVQADISDLNAVKRVYLLGIGGVGMSGLARYFNHKGCVVAGYDRTESALTMQLEQEGIEIVYRDQVDCIPESFKVLDAGTLIIYTPAVPTDSVLLRFFKERGYVLHKRAAVLGLISKDHFTIAVAGTHGKTTTSSMITHILHSSGYACSAFLGGIATNIQSNVLFSGNSHTMVVEADEFDRSFLTLHPDIAIVTSTDSDHLDIYGDHDQLLDSFRLFLGQVSPNGVCVIKQGLDLPTTITYSAGEQADVYAYNIRVEEGTFAFDLNNQGQEIPDWKMGIAGQHNVENAVAAIVAARKLELGYDTIRKALATFKGVKRRFEYIVQSPKHVYIDDYAHHPEELRACFAAVRKLYPGKRLTVVFQPHLFTRTRDFMQGFAAVLSTVDDLLLLPIYPAREQPIAGVTSEVLLSKLNAKRQRVLDKDEAMAYIQQEKPELLVTVGAGDIDRLVLKIQEVLQYD